MEVDTPLELANLNVFGQYVYKSHLLTKEPDFILPLSQHNTIEEKLGEFKNLCESILDDKVDDINMLYFNNLLLDILSRDFGQVCSTVFEVLNNKTLQFREDLVDLCNRDALNLGIFTDMYKKFYYVTNNLNRILWNYDRFIERKINDKKIKKRSYSQIGLFRDCLFYHNILNHKYPVLNGDSRYLYDIFNTKLRDINVTFKYILPLLNIKNYYNRLQYVIPESERAKIFNPELNSNFLNELGTNVHLIKDMVSIINTTMKTIDAKFDRDDKNITSIIEIIKVGSGLLIRDLFNICYEQSLEDRLSMDNPNIDLEGDMLKNFKTPDDNMFISRMLSKLEDMKVSSDFNNKYKKVEVKISSNKFQNLDIDKLNRDIINVQLRRHGAWTYSNDVDDHLEFNIPDELAPYIAIYDAFFNYVRPNKRINWNFNLGFATVSLDIGDSKYELKLTIPQLLLLLEFNEVEKVSAVEISHNMGIPLKNLSPILNTLLASRILARENGQPNDPNIKFYINMDFTSPHKSLDLTTIEKIIKSIPKVETEEEENSYDSSQSDSHNTDEDTIICE